VNILFVGDISGRAGREAFHRHFLPAVEKYCIDFSIANVENAAGGFGVTAPVIEEFFSAGVDVLTSGNHIWDRNDAAFLLDHEPRLLRPANYPPPSPGRGLLVCRGRVEAPVAVINLQGRIFMESIDCPFQTADRLLEGAAREAKVTVIDFHAEATSEKVAMGWHLDGRVSALLGTHTHIQTADERVLPQGTAYITDVGMTGPYDSVIGMRKDAALERFLTGRPKRLSAAKGDGRFAAVVIEVDPSTGRASAIRRLMESG
jgi:metallophosphoesterase (TIGR00282 family)